MSRLALVNKSQHIDYALIVALPRGQAYLVYNKKIIQGIYIGSSTPF